MAVIAAGLLVALAFTKEICRRGRGGKRRLMEERPGRDGAIRFHEGSKYRHGD